MKALKLFILLLSCTISCQVVFAQKKSYPEVDAIWHYHWYSMGGSEGCYTMEITKDTLIQEKKCFEFEIYQFYKYSNPTFRGKKIVLYEENKIYQFYDEKFYLLYDFTVEVGDTIRTELVFWDGNLLPVEFEVTKVEEVEIDGEKLISYDTKTTKSTYLIPENEGEYMIDFRGGIENIGYTYYFFPTFDNITVGDALDGHPSSLRCYSNDDFFYKRSKEDCDYTYQWTGTDEYNTQLYSIYINSDNSLLTIIGLEQYPFDYSIIHPKGNTTIAGKLSDNNIDISKLQPGMYILLVNSSSYKFVKK